VEVPEGADIKPPRGVDMDYNERMIIKTVESPCRGCSRLDEDRELCMRDCDKLVAFQRAMVKFQEEKVHWFSTRRRAA
jgi:hypothetical protein